MSIRDGCESARVRALRNVAMPPLEAMPVVVCGGGMVQVSGYLVAG